MPAEPTIAVKALADSAVELLCGAWTRTTDYLAVYRGLLAGVKVRFDAAGITIPYPQRDLHLDIADAAALAGPPVPRPTAASNAAGR